MVSAAIASSSVIASPTLNTASDSCNHCQNGESAKASGPLGACAPMLNKVRGRKCSPNASSTTNSAVSIRLPVAAVRMRKAATHSKPPKPILST
ncbi:hypothetical protein D3C73_1185730 [compost metagenome]